MATLASTTVTYLDLASRYGPDDKIAVIIELLNQDNPILKDAVTLEGNLPVGHKTTVRTGLPSATWRLLNYGVQPSKSTTAQITDTCGMLEAYAEVDKALADLNGNTAAFRLSEDRAFLESMNQEMATALFYASQDVDKEKITGLAPRYAASSTDKTNIGYNVVKAYASASGDDQTSMWLVTWGNETTHLIYPKGSKGGFQHEDKGQVTLEDSEKGKYEGYRTHYKWDIGLVVRDWRYNVRICNIDTSAINATTVDLYAAMTKAYHKLPSHGRGKSVFYANATVIQALDLQAQEKGKYLLSFAQPAGGKPVLMFRDIPIVQCDALLDTESVVS